MGGGGVGRALAGGVGRALAGVGRALGGVGRVLGGGGCGGAAVGRVPGCGEEVVRGLGGGCGGREDAVGLSGAKSGLANAGRE